MPQKQPKRRRLWLNDGSCIRLRPAYRDRVWSYDFTRGAAAAGSAVTHKDNGGTRRNCLTGTDATCHCRPGLREGSRPDLSRANTLEKSEVLRELTKTDWLSLLAIPEEKIPEVLLLRGTRNLKANYEKHKSYLTDVLEIGSPNGIFEDVLIGSRGGSLLGYASVYGDAMASEITHVFGVLGASLVIQTGCCGALAEGMLPGDLVCATSAHCGEGAAQYYLPHTREVSASTDLIAGLTGASASPVALHRGPIWTTSALLAEGRGEVEDWSRQGYIAADMESATTFATAEYFGMRRLSLLFVFDNPCQGEHIALTDDTRAERRAQGERAMIDLALAVARDYVTAREGPRRG